MKKNIPSSAIANPSPPMRSRRRQWGKIPESQLPINPQPAQLEHPSTPPSITKASPSPITPTVTQPHITLDSILSGNLSRETKRAKRADLKHFLKYLGHPDVIDDPSSCINILQTVTHTTLALYRDFLIQEEKKAAATVSRHLSSISMAFDLLKEEEVISKNPLARVRRPRVSNEGKTSAFTQEQVELILSQPDTSTLLGRRDKVLLCLLFFCGLRRSEIIRVAKSDFFQSQGHTLLWIFGKGRSDKDESVMIPHQIWHIIKAYIEEIDGDLLFTSQSRNPNHNKPDRPLSANRVYSLFKGYCCKAGLSPDNYSPHSARTTFITLCLSGGADIRSTMYAARHSSPEMTVRYDRQRMDLENHATKYLHISINDENATARETAE